MQSCIACRSDRPHGEPNWRIRPRNIVRKIPVVYTGETIYVEPAEVA
jgi:hypothetical protein